MPRTRPKELLVCACLTGAITSSHPMAHGLENSVVVESKTVLPNDTGVCIGVYVENSFYITGIVLPLEMRTVSGGAFIARRFSFSAQGRVAASPLAEGASEYFDGAPNAQNNCSGPVSQSYSHSGTPMDFGSPDAYEWAGGGGAEELASGSDGPVGEGTPSFVICFDVNGCQGSFQIDTCCFSPQGHLSFGTLGPALIPEFTKATLTVESVCSCPCWRDPVCDSTADVLDVLSSIAEGFGGVLFWPDGGCPLISRADLNCDCQVDVVDIVTMIDIAFRATDAPGCNPCESGASCCQ